MRAPAYELRLSGIEGEIALAAAGLAPDQAIPVAIGSIVHQGKPAWFAPLRLEGSVQPQGDRIAFDLAVARRPGASRRAWSARTTARAARARPGSSCRRSTSRPGSCSRRD